MKSLKKGDQIGLCDNNLSSLGAGNSELQEKPLFQREENQFKEQTETCLCLLEQSDVYWDEVVSINELGIEDVYDATVENVHNFVANGIVVHNSLEQDSDIVMFLLRRDYYDPYDKPGHVELIVAKNRHGAVGSVNLTYRKELAQTRQLLANERETGGAGRERRSIRSLFTLNFI